MEEEKEELSTSHGLLHNSRASYSNSVCGGPLENSLVSRLSGVIPSLSRASLGLSDISGSEGLEDQVLLCLLLFDLGFHSLFLPPRRCHTHHALPCCALQVASWTQMISTARPTHCYLVVNLDAQKMKLMDQERSHLDHWKTLLVHWTSPRLPWNLVTSHPLLSIQGIFLAAPMRPLQG